MFQDLLYYFVVFFISTFFNAALGAGGTIVTPGLVLYGVDPVIAVSSMSIGIAVTLAGAFYRYQKTHPIQLEKSHVPFIVLGVIGSFLGANIAVSLDKEFLKSAIGIALMFMLILHWIPKQHFSFIQLPKWFSYSLFLVLFLLTGMYISIIGAGGGPLIMFLYLFATGKTLKEIIPYRMMTAFPILLMTIATFAYLGKIDLTITGIGLVAGLIGGPIMMGLVLKISNRALNIIFSVLVFAVSVLMLIQ